MKWFLDLKTRSKLFIGFGAMLAFLAIAIAIAYIGIAATQESQKSIYQKDFANALDLMSLRSQQNGVRAALLNMMLVTQRSDQETWHQDVKERSKEITAITQRLLERNRGNPQLSSKLEKLKTVRELFAQTRDIQLIPLIYAGKMEQARALALGIQEERYRKMRAIADELGNAAEELAGAAVAESEQKARQAVRLFIVVGILAVLLGVVMTLLLNRIIAEPLKTVSGIAERVAAGDLTVNVPPHHRADEVGALVRAFGAMIENLRRMTRDLQEGVGVLTSSSAEILATTTQVASGAAETATAVSETTATVEEVKQTAQLASQKAKYVSESAQKVSNVSQTGRKSVEDILQGMHRIQEQMESIAESIVRLSEQSQAIGEIIATVNDLAEQSNLLAVNAAIEAAKAGESIRQLADSVTEAAQAATQIAASSQQQMVGMDQVALAMENIKQASVQNVAGTKQAEVAAQNLHELGQRLSATIGSKAA